MLMAVALAACSSAPSSVPPSSGAAIDGGYVHGEQQLTLFGGRYHAVITTGFELDGSFQLEGTQATFVGGEGCTGPGTYRWSGSRGGVDLEAVQEPCLVRKAAVAFPWRRVEALGEARLGHLAVLSDHRSIAEFQGRAEVPPGGAITVVTDILGGYPAFSPTVIRGRPGQRVRVTMVNHGREAHTFTIPGQGVDVRVPAPGETTAVHPMTTFSITIPATGALTFVCTYHLAIGMVGELESS
jgi:plastocyanin